MPKRSSTKPRKLPRQPRLRATFDALVAAAVKILVHGMDGVATAMVVGDPKLASRAELTEELTGMVQRYVAK